MTEVFYWDRGVIFEEMTFLISRNAEHLSDKAFSGRVFAFKSVRAHGCASSSEHGRCIATFKCKCPEVKKHRLNVQHYAKARICTNFY